MFDTIDVLIEVIDGVSDTDLPMEDPDIDVPVDIPEPDDIFDPDLQSVPPPDKHYDDATVALFTFVGGAYLGALSHYVYKDSK